LRKRPDLDKVTDDFVDELFRQEGIYVPACYPMVEDEDTWLAVQKASTDAVERADLIEPEGDQDEEDEESDDDEDDF
jgi:hypothetical protein